MTTASDNVFVSCLTFDNNNSLDKAASLAKLEDAFLTWYARTQEDTVEVRQALLQVATVNGKPTPLPELASRAWQVTGRNVSEFASSKWEQRVSAFIKGNPSMFQSKVGRNGGVVYVGDTRSVTTATAEVTVTSSEPVMAVAVETVMASEELVTEDVVTEEE